MIVVDGRRIDIPGVVSTCWDDDPSLAVTSHGGKPRKTKWIRAVVIHTTKGIPGGKIRKPQYLLPGAGSPGMAAEANARYWRTLKDDDYAGAHLLIDYDGSVVNTADLYRMLTYHATSVNEVAVGIEIVQRNDAGMYTVQKETLVKVCRFLAETFGIQEQVQWPYHGSSRPVPRLVAGAKDVVGFFGHRDQTSNRGPGDPGDIMIQALLDDGFEAVDFATDQDKERWKERQRQLGMPEPACDGVPGPKTVEILKEKGHPHGLWRRAA